MPRRPLRPGAVSRHCLALAALAALALPGWTQHADPNEPAASAATAPAMTMAEVVALLQQQQKQLAEQQALLQSQSLQIANLTRELDTLRTPQPGLTEVAVGPQAPAQDQPPASQDGPPLAQQPAVAADDALGQPPEAAVQPGEGTAEQTAQERRIATGAAVAQAQADDPTRQLLEDFKGAWRLPGTDAALAIGGFVRTAVVYNFDPLEINDRFIVGSIPVNSSETEGIEAESSLTANQSRLNFDLREPTEYGILRAFIEGDFASENETFRLRHAFGQWKRLLAGKTWSAFVDTSATPEEVDFEGLNGRINVRQSQLRLLPDFAESYGFILSLEDPNPQVQNGNGVTRAPDLVLAGRLDPSDSLHMKAALLGRQIRAQNTVGSDGLEKTYAWGLSLSGRYDAPPYLDQRDNVMFQLNIGDGIGRYVNDLSSTGQYDGIFDPETGNLELFDIVAGYVSLQHFWGYNQLRSNFTFGFVELDNPDFIADNAYKRTLRFSSNLFWSPTPRIDLGAEYLLGNRRNENGDNANATQVQLALRYRF